MNSQPAQQPRRNDACRCGSGKKYKRCCGVSSRAAPSVEQELQAAVALLQGGRGAAALSVLHDLRAKHPKNALAHYLFGYGALENGRIAEAISAIVAALDLGLVDAAAYFHLGRAYVAGQDFGSAARCFSQALDSKPGFAEAQLFLANCRFQLGQFSEAARGYRALLVRTPETPELLYNLAHAGFQSGEMSPGEAGLLLQKAIEQAPADANLHAALALVLESDNRVDEAETSARQACALDAQSPAAATALAKILIRQARHEDALNAISGVAAGSQVERMGLWGARGTALEKLCRHREAIEAYCEAKRLEASLKNERFDAAGFEAALARDRKFFAAYAPDFSYSPAGAPTPVFIVGFYRCGSSLLEQMLSMHPSVRPCGERTTLPEIEAAFGGGYPECLAADLRQAQEDRLKRAARTYFEALPAHPTPDEFVVDKQLTNLLRLPLIRLLFPNARVIHVLRHPMDSAISALSHTFRESAPWAQSLDETSRFYSLAWEHVKLTRTVPGLQYRCIRYEDLVQAPEATLRQVTEFLGTPWEPAMLRFHESRRKVHTASYAQVTRPLYRDAVERFRPFLPYIAEDVLRRMTPVVLEMGYTL